MSCCRCRAYVYLPFNRPYSSTTGTTPPLKASNAEWQATAERIQILYEQKMRDYGWYTRSEGVQAVSLSIEDAYLQTLKRDLLLAADDFTLTQESRLDMNEEEKQRAGLLGSTSRSGGDGVDLDENARMAVELIEKLSSFSDIRQDDVSYFKGWKSSEGSSSCLLHGRWKLRFTTAADATFRPGKRGRAVTSQEIDVEKGKFTNVIEFPDNKGKVKGFRVIVEGTPVGSRMRLNFQQIVIERRSRIGLNKIMIPLPNFGFLERFTRGKDGKRRSKGPYFDLLYLDQNMRVHKTGEGKYFVQTRLID